MKKLTKSMKIILISAISVICVAAIVLGCVFGFRDKNPNEPVNPNVPSGPVTPSGPSTPSGPVTPPKPVTWEEKLNLLGSEINTKNTESTEFDIILGVPYEGYVDEGEFLYEVSSNYFVVQDRDTSINYFYAYTSNNDGTFNVMHLTSKQSEGGLLDNSSTAHNVRFFNEKYVMIQVAIEGKGVNFIIATVDGKNSKQVYSFSLDSIGVPIVLNDFCFSSDNKYAYFYLQSLYNKEDESTYAEEFYLIDLSLYKEYKLGTFRIDEELKIEKFYQENGVVVIYNNKIYFYAIYGDKLYSNELENASDINFETFVQLSESKFVIEYSEVVTGDSVKETSIISEDLLNYTNYSYKLFTLDTENKTLSVTDYKLNENVGKLEFSKVLDTNNFYVIKEMYVKDHTLEEIVKYTYYYADGELIFSLTLDENEQDEILYLNSSYVLTKTKLIKLKNSTEFDTIKTFGFESNTILYNYLINSDNILIEYLNENSEFRFALMNLDGEIVREVNQISYGDNVKFNPERILTDGVNNLSVYDGKLLKLDYDNLKFNEITNVVTNSQIINNSINNGKCFYLVDNNNSYSLYGFDGKLLIDKIKTYYLIEEVGNEKAYIYIETETGKNIINLNLGLDVIDSEGIKLFNSINESDEKGTINKVTPYAKDVDKGDVSITFNYYGGTKSDSSNIYSHQETHLFDGTWGDAHQYYWTNYTISYDPGSPGYSWSFNGWSTSATANSGSETGFDYRPSSSSDTKTYYATYKRTWYIYYYTGTDKWENKDWEQYSDYDGTTTNCTVPSKSSTNESFSYKGYHLHRDGDNDPSAWKDTISVAFEVSTGEIDGVYQRDGLVFEYYESDNTDELITSATGSARCDAYWREGYHYATITLTSTCPRIGYSHNYWNYGSVTGTRYELGSSFTPYSDKATVNNTFKFYANRTAYEYTIDIEFLTTSGKNAYGYTGDSVNTTTEQRKLISSVSSGNISMIERILKPGDTSASVATKTFKYTYNDSLQFGSINTWLSSADFTTLFEYQKVYVKRGTTDSNSVPINYDLTGWLIGKAATTKFDYLINIKDGVNFVRHKDSTIEYDGVKAFIGDATNNETGGNFKLYAHYSPRPLEIYDEVHAVNGATPVSNESSDIHLTYTNFDYAKELKHETDTTKLNNNYNEYKEKLTLNVGFGENLVYNLSLSKRKSDNKIELSGNPQVPVLNTYYYIGRIEIHNYTYRTTNDVTGTLYKTTIYLVLNVSDDTLTINTSSCSAANGGTLYIVDNSSSGGKDIYMGTGTYNKINIKFENAQKYTLKVTNCNLPMSDDGTLSDTTVSSTGKKGLTIKTYAMPGYGKTNNEGYEYSNFFEDIEFTNGTLKDSFDRYSIVPAVSEGGYFKFWLNGHEFQTKQTIASHKTTYGNNELGAYTFDLKAGFNNANISSTKECNVYIDKINKTNYVAYIDIWAINAAGGIHAVPNYGNTSIYAIEPDQERITHSDKSGSLTAKDGADSANVYELNSYISSITFGNTTITLSRPIKDIDVDKYNTTTDTPNDNYWVRFGSNDNLTDSNLFVKLGVAGTNEHVFTYKGKGYRLLYAYKSNAADTSKYRLYFGVEMTTGRYMYFLLSVGASNTGRLSSGTIKTTNNTATIKVTLTSITNTITVNSSLADANDMYTATATTGMDFYYGVNETPTKTDKLGNASSTFTSKPSNQYLFKFTPKEGYLIDSVKVTLKNNDGTTSTTLLSMTLDRTKLGGIYDAEGFALVGAIQGVGSVIYDSAIFYKVKYTPFKTNNGASGFSKSYGIYYINLNGKDWNTAPKDGDDKMESLYLYIPNIYNDVSVEVKTVSYFEFVYVEELTASTKNMLGLKNDSLGHLKFAYKEGDNWKEITAGTEGIVIQSANETNNFARVIFFGLARTFRDGIAFYASNPNESYSFSGAQYYSGRPREMVEESSAYLDAPFDKIRNNPNDFSQNSLYVNDKKGTTYTISDDTRGYIEYLYVEILSTSTAKPYGLYNFFNGGHEYGFTESASGKRDYVAQYKYTAVFTVRPVNVEFESQSWLRVDDTTSQLDDPKTKTGTWFNDIIMTNIDYYSKGTYTVANNILNWQNLKFYDGENTIVIDENGYGVHFRYYEVPGYYLNKIQFSNAYFDYTDVLTKTNFKDNTYYSYTDASNKFSFFISYKSFSLNQRSAEGEGYFDIYIYACKDLDDASRDYVEYDTGFTEGVNSLSVLASKITVNIYSAQYSIALKLNDGIDRGSDSPISSTDVEQYSGDNLVDYTEPYVQIISYDRMQAITTNLSLTGYTFIGWGSPFYNITNDNRDGIRYDSESNTWSSVSLWDNYTRYFDISYRNELIGLQEETNFGSDFYVSNGYFITDTGFIGMGGYPSSNRYSEVEDANGINKRNYSTRNGEEQLTNNYNFWCVYASIFTGSIGTHFTEGTVDENGETVKFSIDLNAIWKANTYVVSLNANDIISGISTVSTTHLAYNSNFNNVAINTSGIILPDNGTNSGLSYKNGSIANDSGTIFYLYVTFDTNDWYVLQKDNNNATNTNWNVYSTPINGVEKIPLTKFIIDRFGYSWLGWFSRKLDAVFQEETTYYGKKKINGEPEYPTVEDEKTGYESSPWVVYGTSKYGSNTEFITLNISNYTSKFSDATYKNVVEISKTHFTYFKECSAYIVNERIHSTDKYNDDIFFYIYNSYSNVSYTADYLNTYLANQYTKYIYDGGENNYDTIPKKERDANDNSKINTVFISTCLTYYDTALDYSFYNYIRSDNPSYTYKPFYWGKSGVNSSFRYVTLYSYWETNLYNVIIDYRDANSGSSVTTVPYGSSVVTKPGDAIFMPTYFNDLKFEQRLNVFLPTRIGYDFVGWALEANPVRDKDNKIVDYTFSKSDIYSFTDALAQKGLLYTNNKKDNGDDLKIVDLFSDDKYREKYGDDEDYHYVYMFAVWQVQTFTINVSLNINNNTLKNLYDLDSEFALALYETSDKFKNYGYTGIKDSFAKQNILSTNRNNAFTEIVANVMFEITFDKNLSDAKLTLSSTMSYNLQQLYATSAGYYFLGWFSNPECKPVEVEGDTVKKYQFVVNNTQSTYSENGIVNQNATEEEAAQLKFNNLVSGVTGKFNGNYGLIDRVFDVNLYENLYTSYYDLKYIDVATHNDDITDSINKLDLNPDGKSTNDSIYKTSLLNTIDYISTDENNNYSYVAANGNDKKYFDTMKLSSSGSSNFGFIKDDSTSHYIMTETYVNESSVTTYRMYYINNITGEKFYLIPSVKLPKNGEDGGELKEYAANFTLENNKLRFRYDGSNFYIDEYVVRFYYNVNSGGVNAYYIDKSYDKSELKSVEITFKATKTAGSANPKDAVGIIVTLKKTREFTIYADWDLKDDLKATVSNANHNGITSTDNPGHLGYYEIMVENSDDSNNKKSANTTEFNQTSIDIEYAFYDKVNLFVSPYFNGRFLSELKLSFYAYESLSMGNDDDRKSNNNFISSYDKVKYILTLKFSWVSKAHTISLTSCTLHRETEDGKPVLQKFTDATGVEKSLMELGYLSNSGTFGDKYSSNDIAITGLDIISLLDRMSFNDNTYSNSFGYETMEDTEHNLLLISKYQTALLNYKDNNDGDGRIDVNNAYMQFRDIMTNFEVDCKFAVQTYDLEVYNIFDPLGLNIKQVPASEYYEVSDTYSTLEELVSNSKSAYSASGRLTYSERLSKNAETKALYTGKSVATILQNCSLTELDEDYKANYNVPYGCFIYGQYFYDSIRPVDVEYNPTTRKGYNTSKFTGYSYIYDNYYKYGSYGQEIKANELDTTRRGAQGYTILGSKSLFDNSLRESSSLYTFVSWYVPVMEKDGSFKFVEYNENREATQIMENTMIFGYYYANNQPTNVEFYTWDDSGNEYTMYEENIDEYTLQSTSVTMAYEVKDNQISKIEEAKVYKDADSNIILYSSEAYGIDVAKFGTRDDIYTTAEITGIIQSNRDFLTNNLIRNYWFYRNYTAYLYYDDGATETTAGTPRRIKYDNSDGALTKFYYVKADGGKQYVQLLTDKIAEDAVNVYIYKVNSASDVIVFSDSLKLKDVIQTTTYGVVKAKLEKSYSYDLPGSAMYAYESKDITSTEQINVEKYFPIKKIENYKDDPFLDSLDAAKIEKMYNATTGKYSARFYVEIRGKIYYMVAETSSSNNNVNILYNYEKITEDGVEKYVFTDSGLTADVKNIDTYYLRVTTGDDGYKFIPVQQKAILCTRDGTIYYSPYTTEYKTDDGDSIPNAVNYLYQCSYNGQTYYFNYNDKTFYKDPSFMTKVTIDDIGAPFSAYTPVNSNYRIILEESNTNWQFSGVNINSLPSPNIGFWYNNNSYGYVGYINFRDSDLSYISSTVAAEDFAYKEVYSPYESNKLLFKNERIYDVAEKYINIVYNDSKYDVLSTSKTDDGAPLTHREYMIYQIDKFCKGYKLDNFLKSLITVGNFYTTKESNVVKSVDILIPVTIDLENGIDGKFQITITVKYNIDIIDTNTNIDGKIYAIPIYSRNVIEFNNDENSITVNDSKLTIKADQMYTIYFENEGNIKTHYFNTINKQYLKFALLDSRQYNLLLESNNHPDMLSFILNKYEIPVISQEKGNSIIFDFSNTDWLTEKDDGSTFELELTKGEKYYIIAYYEKVISTLEGVSYVIRTSDNIIAVEYKENGTVEPKIQGYVKEV